MVRRKTPPQGKHTFRYATKIFSWTLKSHQIRCSSKHSVVRPVSAVALVRRCIARFDRQTLDPSPGVSSNKTN
jgi:hypothetical protein